MNKSHLLINEPPLLVPPTLAQIIGLNEAIILQQVHYWLSNPKAEGRTDEQGVKWTYNTYEQWQENFPFWSVDKIQRIFLKLEELGVIVSAQLDAKKRDMTKFYRIDYDKLCMMDDSFLRPSNTAKINDVKMNTETTTENNISAISEPTKKGDILDGILDLTFKPKAVREAFAKFFRLTPNWEAKYNRQFLEWAVEIGMTPEQVERAADVWRSDKRFNWSVPTLRGIQEHWFELMETPKKEEVKEYTRLL